MSEYELRKKISNGIMEAQLLPTITESSLKEVEYKKYPIENLSALGVATQPLVAAMHSLGGKNGTSGIYRVNTKGLEMFESQGGFIGSLKTTEGTVGGGQAVMTPLECDPTMMFMAMSLMTIEKKLDDIKNFMQELGTGFCFISNEYPIKIGNNYNYIDLLLFNYEYNCFVVVELKVTELKKEHIGQIQVYMNYIDENLRKINQYKTIGIIICKQDNKYVIKYCSDDRIIAREYELV